MTTRKTLSPEDRAFFADVARAAFTNPFGEDRLQIDRTLAGAVAGEARQAVLEEMLGRLDRRLGQLRPLSVQDFRGEDREIVEAAVMFNVFHRHGARADAWIQAELREVQSGPVSWAAAAMADLVGDGFPQALAARAVGFFFQIRRAYHFIDTTLVGDTPSMQELRARLWRNVFTDDLALYERHLWDRMEDFSTLVIGETGTGKGTAAAAIGRSGWIAYEPKKEGFAESFTALFVPVNLSEFPATLLESELFGHVKGAFTGAVERHRGVFERCRPHGTIFLDEIGEVEVPAQIKLLRVLQERAFSPVGGHEALRFEGRVVAATNQSLDQRRAEGRFRDDFYYRLCSDVVVVPPLRVRLREDGRELGRLVEHIAARLVGAPAPELVARVEEVVGESLGPEYGWPGNVRELEQCVRRVIVARTYEGDRSRQAAGAGTADPFEALARQMAAGEVEARQVQAEYCRLLYARLGSYEEVGRRTGLDRRTVKKYVDVAEG